MKRAISENCLTTALVVLIGSVSPVISQTEALDVSYLLPRSKASASHSAIDIGPIGNIFDGNTSTLARTPAINPMVVTLAFTTPKTLTKSRVWFLGGNNRWRVEIADTLVDLDAGSGSFRVALDWRTDAEGAWREGSFATPHTCSYLRLKLQRLTGDDYVHLNEWQVFTEDRPFHVTDFQATDTQTRLIWNSSIGQWYEVQTSTNLGTWETADFIKGEDPSASVSFPGPANGQRFFRVSKAQPEDRPAITKKVLVLNIDPIIESQGGRRLNQVMGWNDPKTLNAAYLADLTTSSGGYVNWQVVHWIDIDLWPVKTDGFAYNDTSYLAAWTNGGFHEPDSISYPTLLDRVLPELGNRSIHQVTAAGEVDEVICWAFPYGGFYESQMVGSTAYWCNSPPIIRSSPLYVVMGLNPERGVAEALHSFGHRSESIMARVYGSWSGTSQVNHLWDRFTRVAPRHSGATPACGNIHFPPNANADYDYSASLTVQSEADDWLNFPILTGITKPTTASTWGGPDHHRNFLRWWFTRLPKAPGRFVDPGNPANHGKLNNWWSYIVDMNEYAESR